MSVDQDLLCLERASWEALTAGGAQVDAFFRDTLASPFIMLLPGGTVLADRDSAIRAMQGAPWDTFELSEMQVLPLDDRCAVVAYRASARRGQQRYEALFNSTYVNVDGRWLMAVHQQTPI